MFIHVWTATGDDPSFNALGEERIMSSELIRFACRKCSVRLRAYPDDVGKQQHCPKCGHSFVVPQTAKGDDEKKPNGRGEEATDPDQEKKLSRRVVVWVLGIAAALTGIAITRWVLLKQADPLAVTETTSEQLFPKPNRSKSHEGRSPEEQQEWRRQQEGIIARLEPFAPIVRYVGDDVAALEFSERLADDDLQPIKGLTNLTELSLSNQSMVTDAGLMHLKGLKKLKRLNVRSILGPDIGLERLNELVAVRTRSPGPKITDAGLEHLKGLPSLEYLNLEGTRVTDAGLRHLKGLTSLETLRLGYTQITDAGLEHLRGLTRLDTLRLSDTRIEMVPV